MKYGNRPAPGRRWKQIVGSPLSILLLLVIFGVLAKASWGIYSKAHGSEVKLSEAQADYQKLEAQQADLSDQVGYLSTEQGIEAEMRTKFHAVKPGESVAVVVGSSSETADAFDASSSVQASSPGWWARMLHAIGL